MYKSFLIWASILGAVAVMLGAFGAHALQKIVAEQKIEVFKTGVTYQFYHVFALLALAGLQYQKLNLVFKWAGIFYIWGIICFSGSLYLFTFIDINQYPNLKILGIITPIGGLFFIVGWLCMLVGVCRMKNRLPM